MSKLRVLVRAGLKANFGLSLFFHRVFREKKDRWVLPIIAFSLLGLIPFLYGLAAFIKDAYFILKPIGQESALLGLGLVMGQFLVLLFGVYYVIAAFYFSRDLEMLIALPLTPSEVLLSKYIVVAANEYLTIAPIVLPFLITIGFISGGGFSYWMISAIVYLALPIIPLAIVSIIVVIMMRLINLSRKKDLLIFLGGTAVIGAAIGFQVLTQQASSGSTSARDAAAFLLSPDSLLHKVGSAFPPSIWAARALQAGISGKGLLNLAAFVGTSLLSFGALIVLGERYFYRGVVGLAEKEVRKRTLTKEEMFQRISSGRRAIFAIFMREVRTMNRTPAFLLNGVLSVILLPVLFILMARPGLKSPSWDLQKLIESGNSFLVILLAALFMVLCGSLNGTSSSTFSREGTQFWISRVIPAAPGEQIAAKFLHSYLIGALGVLSGASALIILVPIGLSDLATATGLALITGALLTAVGMFIDLARPLLDWTNPQKAIKQNLNVLLAMFADAAILAAAFFGIKALIDANISETLILLLLFSALAAFTVIGYRALVGFAEKRYREIDT